MRIVYAGTPEFAVPALSALIHAGHPSTHQVVAVYTQPDRPAGRGRALAASPVKQCALQHQLPVEQPLNFRDDAAVARLRDYQPDLMVVAAYGLILPQRVLDIPTQGCLNIHASLLPRWRGAAPIQRAILAGDTQTGITLMRMEAGLDTGPMLLEQVVPITSQDTAATLHDTLAKVGATLLMQALQALPRYLSQARPQPEVGVTYASKLRKEEARIDWTQSATQIEYQVRAFNPWPVAETLFAGQQLRLWHAQALLNAQTSAAPHGTNPGTVIHCDASGIHVACGQGVLCVTQVQQAGRKQVLASEFSRGHSLVGLQLGAQPSIPSIDIAMRDHP